MATQQTPGANRPAWSYKANINWPDARAGSAAWMADEGQFLISCPDTGSFIGVRRYNPTTDTVGVTIPYVTGAFHYGDLSTAYSPSRRVALIHRVNASYNTYVRINTAANSMSLVTITGPTLPYRCSLKYDPVRDRFIAYTDEEGDRRTLFSIHPDTWAVTQINPTGTAPSTPPPFPQYNGIHGRFQYCADYDVFLMVNSVYGNVYIYKPVGWVMP